MQIPRGTFRALKRGCDLHTLIQELKDTAFCGSCRIAPGSGSITIVFDKGNIRLAEFDDLEGDAAVEKLFQSGPVTVDAVLHALSAAQLDLAVEFSPLSADKSASQTRGQRPRSQRLHRSLMDGIIAIPASTR